jgi:hypothetical protein
MIPTFDAFIAIDWSGAAGNYAGIAVAVCNTGRAAPRLVRPPSARRWSRQSIAEWVMSRLGVGSRLLIGFDFAFGFPYEPEHGYLAGLASGIDDIGGLWSLIEMQSCGESDFGCSRFVACPDYASLFWASGSKPVYWVERKRLTEHACAEATRTRPDTLYKMLGSKQVGKASITGMRVLRHVRSLSRDLVAIWPFDTVRTSCIVEIYPTMFRWRATRSLAKIRSRSELDRALRQLRSRPMPMNGVTEYSDHETDALLSAAGLRLIAGDPDVWTPGPIASPRVQREGWIFGVTS